MSKVRGAKYEVATMRYLAEKFPQLDEGGPNPFIDPEGFTAHLDRQEKNFSARLEEQKKAGVK
jgi:hypothetical protein